MWLMTSTMLLMTSNMWHVSVEVVEVEDVGKLVANWWPRLLQSSLLSTARPAPYCSQSWGNRRTSRRLACHNPISYLNWIYKNNRKVNKFLFEATLLGFMYLFNKSFVTLGSSEWKFGKRIQVRVISLFVILVHQFQSVTQSFPAAKDLKNWSDSQPLITARRVWGSSGSRQAISF